MDNYRKNEAYCKILVIFLLALILSLIVTFSNMPEYIHVTYIDVDKIPSSIYFSIQPKFLSFALDSRIIAEGFNNFNLTNPKLMILIKLLAPAYLRIGGSMSDQLVFTTDRSMYFKVHGDNGIYKPNFTMNDEEWLALNRLAKNTNMDLIFNLNVMRRFPNNGSWDYNNAEKLISFSNNNNLNVCWELGNEPTTFYSKYNKFITPEQLAKDYRQLRRLLNKYDNYKSSPIFGPEISKPNANDNISEVFLKEFLDKGGKEQLNAITWHQYYFSSDSDIYVDFLNTDIYDLLKWQIIRIKKAVGYNNMPLWLGETSAASGGGAYGYSGRYIASFMWLDKLGISAQFGLDVVIRQSIFRGFYALINNNYNPNPDWWVSVLFKKFVGPHLVPCYNSKSSKIRIYCHYKPNFLTIYGMNVWKYDTKIRIEGVHNETDAYILTSNHLLSDQIFLNGILLQLNENNELPNFKPRKVSLLPFLQLPPYSMFFLNIPTKQK